MSIYNLNGQKLMESKTTDALDVSSLGAGVYVLNVVTVDGTTHIDKLLKI